MKWLTANAGMKCTHAGTVMLSPSQAWVRIDGTPVLVAPDPAGRPIRDCANLATQTPCLVTGPVIRGCSAWITIDGHPVATDRVVGQPVGTVAAYSVTSPGQSWVVEREEAER